MGQGKQQRRRLRTVVVLTGALAAMSAPAAAAATLGTISTVAGGAVPGPIAATLVGQQPVRVATATVAGTTFTYVADRQNDVVTRIDDGTGLQVHIAGLGAAGFSGDGGPAALAAITPQGVAADSAGDVFIADGGTRVRFIPAVSGTHFGRAMTAGDIYTIAGTGTAGFGGDGGPATSAEIANLPSIAGPGGNVAADGAGDFAIADEQNNRIRFVPNSSGTFFGQSMTAGDIYTVAGTGTGAFGGDTGPATAATLDGPDGVALDTAGDLAIADNLNERVRFVPSTSGTFFNRSMLADHIYTVAGDGTAGLSGNNVTATTSHLDNPIAVAFDPSGGLAITNVAENEVAFVANGTVTYLGQSRAAGNIYDIAGDQTAGFSGDGALASGAQLDVPEDAAIDAAGDLLVADTFNDRVRFVPVATASAFGAVRTANDIYTVAGNGSDGFSGDGAPATASELAVPASVVHAPSGGFAIVDFFNNRIRFLATASGTMFGQAMTAGDLYTIAGNGIEAFGGDGAPATAAELNEPGGVAFDAQGDAVIADRFNNRVRFVPATSGTFFGQAMIALHIYTIAGNGTAGFSGDGGPATSAELRGPTGIVIDGGGNVMMADANNNRVRFVAASSGTFFGQAMAAGDIYTIAGTGVSGFSGDGAPATTAQLDEPEALALDGAGDLVLADAGNNRVRVVAARTGTFFGQAMTAADIYTIAGTGTAGFAGDGGPPTSAQLSFPAGVAVDSIGDIAIADEGNDRLRFVPARSGAYFGPTLAAGQIYTVAGDGVRGFGGDGGPATSAELHQPAGVAFDGTGNVLIADTGNNHIRMITGTIPTPTTGPPSNRFVLVSKRVKRNGDVVLAIRVPGAGRLAGSASFVLTRRVNHAGRRKVKRITVKWGHKTVRLPRAGTFTIALRAARAAKHDLISLHKERLALKITFTPTGGTRRTSTFGLTVKRSRKGVFS